MNVALPAIVAFLLVVPGLIYLNVRPRTTSNPPPNPTTPLSIEAVVVTVAAIVINAVWYCVVAACISRCDLTIRAATAVDLLTGHVVETDDQKDPAVRSIADHPIKVASYFVGLYIASILLARYVGPRLDPLMVRWAILPDKDARANEWNKFFKTDGETITIVTTVVELGGTAHLFVGFLVELYFDPKTQELDRFVLADVWRRKLDEDEPSIPLPTHVEPGEGPPAELTSEEIISDQWYSIEGNVFVIRYSEARTINIRYWKPE